MSFILLFAVQISHAATFDIADGDVAALKSAFAFSSFNNENDTINLASGGTYILTEVENTSANGENGLRVVSTDNGHNLTINGNGATIERSSAAGTPGFRILEVVGSATISNLTLGNGEGLSGGAIYNGSGTLTLQSCTFNGNLVYVTSGGTGGGAIYNNSGTVSVTGCSFTGNTVSCYSEPATGGGAAIYNDATAQASGLVAVVNSTFTDNVCTGTMNGRSSGAAIYNALGYNGHIGTVTVNGCLFSGNHANFEGGAILNCGSILVFNSLLEGNYVSDNVTATGSGGAIANQIGTATVENCTFQGNQAKDTEGRGGAIHNEAVNTTNASLTVIGCTFSGNRSPNGSAIHVEGYSPVSSTLHLGNTILAKGSGGVSIVTEGTTPSVISMGYNLSDDAGGGFLTGPADQVNTDPKLDPAGLQDNGGLTQTIGLVSGSPAIDRGKAFGLTTDQRGQSRPVDLPGYVNASGGDASDIGAYEAIDAIQSGPTLIVNTLTDHDDGVCGDGDCSLRDAVRRANALSGTQTITFSAGVTGTMTLTGGELDVTQGIVMTGPGARTLAISGNSASRVFMFGGGSSVISTISGLTIRDGSVTGAPGSVGQGGGIFNGQKLNVNDCQFTGNHATGGRGFGPGFSGQAGQGGAIFSDGILNLNGCTFASGNNATGGNGVASVGRANGGSGGDGQGGAVYNALSLVTMTNCTLNGNNATGGNGTTGANGGNGGSAAGGGVGNTGSLTMTACTVSGNSATGGTAGTGSSGNGAAGASNGGGVANLSNTSTLTDTIVAANTRNNSGGLDVDGDFASTGYNLIGTADHSTGFTATGDIKGTDAAPLNAGLLGPPSNTGGPTDTLTLASNSPAIDASTNTVAPHRDQRGYLRIGRTDIGAFEYNGTLVNLLSGKPSGNDFALSAEVVRGKVYRLERKLKITDAQWLTIPAQADLTATNNDIEVLTDSGAMSLYNQVFYRVFFIQ
jgi:CSLREA domain-containing protein